MPHLASVTAWEDAVRCLLSDAGNRELVEACYFDPPINQAARRYAAGDEWRSLQKYLPRLPGQAVDLGAGNGILSYALAASGWKVWAIEPDSSNLVGSGAIRSLASEEKLPIEVVEAYGEALPLADGCADLVMARQVLHHAQDLGKLCAEVARVLKPGGTFIALRDHVIDRDADLPEFLAAHPLHRMYGGEHAFTLNEYLGALRGAGLEVSTVLRPHHSPINRGVRGLPAIRQAIDARTRQTLGRWAVPLTTSEPVVTSALWVASWLDRRPGRVFSFVCQKPMA